MHVSVSLCVHVCVHVVCVCVIACMSLCPTYTVRTPLWSVVQEKQPGLQTLRQKTSHYSPLNLVRRAIINITASSFFNHIICSYIKNADSPVAFIYRHRVFTGLLNPQHYCFFQITSTRHCLKNILV